MKKLNKNHVIYTLAIIFSTASIVHIVHAKQTFVSVNEAERNILIEEQHNIQEKAQFWKEKRVKEVAKLEEQQRKVDDIDERLNTLASQHDKNTGRIEQITRTIDLYEGL